MKLFIRLFIGVFCGLFILTFEFDYSIFPSIHQFVNPFFEKWVFFTGTFVFGLEESFSPLISSDTLGMNINIFNLFFLTVSVCVIVFCFFKNKICLFWDFFLVFLRYYLCLQLLIYGLDKLFKTQFYLPEPNILFTPLKDLSKDILYWSSVGASRSYSVFMGSVEVICAGLLIFRKTKLIGLVIGIGVMINVVAVNFSFDISVKIYSLFLLASFVILLLPYLVSIFIANNPISCPENTNLFTHSKLTKWLKIVLVLILFTEGIYPYYRVGNFNDDTFSRPIYHGAYQVTNSDSEIENVFIHRGNYIIFKDMQGSFKDYKFTVDTLDKQFLITDYEENKNYVLDYEENNNSLISLSGRVGEVDIYFTLQAINWRKSTLLQNEFNWIVK